MFTLSYACLAASKGTTIYPPWPLVSVSLPENRHSTVFCDADSEKLRSFSLSRLIRVQLLPFARFAAVGFSTIFSHSLSSIHHINSFIGCLFPSLRLFSSSRRFHSSSQLFSAFLCYGVIEAPRMETPSLEYSIHWVVHLSDLCTCSLP